MIIHRRENFSNAFGCSCLLTHLKEMLPSLGASTLLFWLKLSVCMVWKQIYLSFSGSHHRVGDFELGIFYLEVNLEDVSQECTQCSLTRNGHAAPQHQTRVSS